MEQSHTTENSIFHGKYRRSLIAAAGVSALLLIGAIFTGLLLSGNDSTQVFSTGTADTAKFSVHVVEGNSEKPIAGADVVVVETGKTYSTDASGDTEAISVPVIRDTRYDNILQKPWGEVTLIIYKEGYIPYALFYLQVVGGQTCKGVKILLFEEGTTSSSEPFSIIEGPNRVWVNALIEKYRPSG
jgi:hypothetical protein